MPTSVSNLNMDAITVGLIMMTIIFVTLTLGFPIALSIGSGALTAMFLIMPFEQATIVSAQRMFAGLNSFSLLAIPFFILAGNIMNNGGIADRLVRFAGVFSRRLPGYLAQTNIVANMLFGAISGSGMAAAAAMGSTIGPMEEEEGYDKNWSAAVNAASAPCGMILPPSNLMIIYAMTAGAVSIAGLFMAGYLPGILWGLGCMIVAHFQAKKRGYVSTSSYNLKESLAITWQAIPSLTLIFIVIGGILFGWFTPTEGSAIAVAYALLLSFIYKTIKIKNIPKLLLDTAKITAVVQFMVGLSAMMSFVMAFTRLPDMARELVMNTTDSFIVILIIINILMLIVGLFMDPTPAVLIFTPIFLPIVMQFGMHPVHFGIMLVFNKAVGTITPPIGPILFTACRIGNVKIEKVVKPLMPYVYMLLILLLFVMFVPELSMLLPRLFGLV